MAWLHRIARIICNFAGPNPADGSHRRPRSRTLDAAQPYQTGGLFSLPTPPPIQLFTGVNQPCWRRSCCSAEYLEIGLRFTISGDVQWTGLFQLEHESRWARKRVAGVHLILTPVLHVLAACGQEARIAALALSPPSWMPPVARRNSHAGSLLRIHKITGR